MIVTASSGLVGPSTRRSWLAHAIGGTLTLFLVSCIFDPADQLLTLKVWLFLLASALTLVRATLELRPPTIRPGLLVYCALFIAIPLLSIARNAFVDGSLQSEGLNLLKGYLLIVLAPLLVLSGYDLLPRMAQVLGWLAMAIVGTYIALQIEPDLFAFLYLFGTQTGMLFLDNREYGEDVSFLQVYFVTSPMLAISIAWYFQRAQTTTKVSARRAAWAMMAFHVTAMLLAGTRNNIIVAIVLPLALWILNTRQRAAAIAVTCIFAVGLGASFAPEVAAFLDPAEVSNDVKLALLGDYARILADPWTLLLGRGLGASEFWTAKTSYLHISELTYLELVRNFGLPGAALMLALLVFPIWLAYSDSRSNSERVLAVGYGFYLVMCASNPNLFSSMGILILTILLSRLFQPVGEQRRYGTVR